MFKFGVVDPAKVTRSALQNAASIAALFLTTEAVVAEKPEKEKAAPPCPAAATWTSTSMLDHRKVGRGARTGLPSAFAPFPDGPVRRVRYAPVTAEVRTAIRWSDVDAYGHVNNAVFLNYLEEARDRLVDALFGDRAWDFVVARVAIDYRSELNQEDREVVVQVSRHGVRHVERADRRAGPRRGRPPVRGGRVGGRGEEPGDGAEPPADRRGTDDAGASDGD